MPTWLFFIAILVLLAVLIRVQRGDGRTDLRRCPKCWYAMDGHTGLKCPECGHAARREEDLFQPRRSRRLIRLVAGSLMATWMLWTWLVWPGSWVSKTPRFVVRTAVQMAEPYRGIPNTAMELAIAKPDPKLRDARDAWQRARWQQQVNNCVRQWAEAVLESKGPITKEELIKLVPLAELAHESYVQTGGLAYAEGWLSEIEKDSIARMRANTTSPQVKLRAEWVLGELQYLGGDYSHRFDWGVVPSEVLAMALAHPDPEVRLYGVVRVGSAANLALVTKGKISFPALADTIRDMATNDPDGSVRAHAKDVVSYIEAFNIK